MIVYEKFLRSTFQAVDLAVMEILGELRARCPHIDKSHLFKVNFMLRELLNNAVEHGNAFDESKHVYCRVEYDSNSLKFQISDEGDGIVESQDEVVTTRLRERSRGYETILAMDFKYDIQQSTVYVSFDLDKEV